MNKSAVLVLGGGVAGLAAAAELGRHGIAVTLLEARDRLGGRIFTTRPHGWPGPVELGAEFVHGGNPALWRALRRARIATRQVPVTHWNFQDNAVQQIADVTNAIEHVTGRIQPRKMQGWTFAEFIRRNEKTLAREDREMALGFVEGFEAAPAGRMSASAMAGESLDTSEQFGVPRGYDHLVEWLARQARAANVVMHLACPIRHVDWRKGGVIVRAAGRSFHATSAVVTLPLGVLQARASQRGAVAFTPHLREKAALIRGMGVGHVIRLTLRIDAEAWRRVVPQALTRRRGGFGFVHSRVEGVPVWWALGPHPVLTGWAGGPAAQKLAGRSRRGIYEKALTSLSHVFGTPKVALRRAVIDFATHNWSRDPFSRGAYSFTVAGLDDASARLREPLRDTLFFAGEATADGAEIGTVQGALASGLRAAKEVLAALR